MSIVEGVSSLGLPAASVDEVKGLITKLKRKQVHGAFSVALSTAVLLRKLCAVRKHSTAHDLMELVRGVGRCLQEAAPLEVSCGNIVRRIMYIIREEHSNAVAVGEAKSRSGGSGSAAGSGAGSGGSGAGSGSGGGAASAAAAGGVAAVLKQDRGLVSTPSLHNMLQAGSGAAADLSRPSNAKHHILEGITDLVEELKSLYINIAEQAVDHIHSNEVILTLGKSRTVEEFLVAAAKKRTFEVYVAQCAPLFDGQDQAARLCKAGIHATVLTDAAVFAMLARVNTVIIGTHAVMANGGLITHAGAHMIAQAAKHHSVPLVVCVGLYKLCPQYAFDQDTINDLNSPSTILPFDESDGLEDVHVVNPQFDYIPPEYVSLYITNQGGQSPSYIYRLLSEYYSQDDNDL